MMSRPFFYIDSWMEWSEHCKWDVTSNIGALNIASEAWLATLEP